MKTDFMKDCKMIMIGKICELNPTSKMDANLFYYIDLGSIDKGKWTEKKIISKSEAPNRAQRVLKYNDIIFQSVRPYNMGHYLLKSQSDLPVVASTGFIQLRVTNANADYIYQLLYESHFNYNVNLRCTGSNYPAINADSFSEIYIPLPSLEIQQKIADILSTQDKLIKLKQNLINQKKQQKKWLMQNLLTGKIRLKGLSGKWKKIILKEITQLIIDNRGKTPPIEEKGIDLIEIASISNDTKSPDYNKVIKWVSFNTYNNWFRKHITINDILISTVGQVGISSIIKENRGAIAQNLIGIRINSNNNSEYIYYLLNSDEYWIQVKKVTMEAIQPSLKLPHLLNFTFKIPSLPEQTAIAEILSAQDMEIELLEKQLEQEKLKKKALMQLLLTVK